LLLFYLRFAMPVQIPKQHLLRHAQLRFALSPTSRDLFY
jgi:hypothetical protein